MNPTCDLCGRKLTFEFEATCAWSYGLDETSVDGHWTCPATPDQHRIAELEKQVAELETEIEARGPVAVTKRMTPEGGRIVELERQLEEAKHTVYQREVRIETLDTENNMLWNQKNSALSERDEALTALRAREADVLALREWITTTAQHPAFCRANFNGEACTCGKSSVLSSTSATAQEILERAGRQARTAALKDVWDFLKGHELCGDARLAAAILGEEEKP